MVSARALTGCVAVVVLASCGSAAPSSPAASVSAGTGTRLLGISPYPKQGAGPSEMVNAVDQTVQAGARGAFVSETWSALEPRTGTMNLSGFRGSVDYQIGRGFALLMGIQVLNTTVNSTPADLNGVSFDSPQMKSRFHALIDHLKPMIDQHVRYLSIGNEVDIYLGMHPQEWATYAAFYKDAVSYVHANLPGVQVGVTVTFDGANAAQAAQVARLTAASDAYIVTYYPLGAGYRPRPPGTAGADINRMVVLAGQRPIVLQEVGYPSASALGSSEQAQATFMGGVLDAWGRVSAGRIPFLNIFALHDFSPDFCRTLSSYYGLNGNAFQAYLCSLGLRRADDTPKAAWQAVVSHAKTIGLP